MLKKFSLYVFIAMLFTALGLNAQVTTSALSGIVVDDANETLVGATVQAVHVPSGTQYNAVTNLNGRFTIQGMRPGGPYSVQITYVGFKPKTYEGINLALGETYDLHALMSVNANDLAEVIVQAQGGKFNQEKTGATTNISNLQLNTLPTVNRSITDFTRLSPYANGMSFAGGDGRSTNFTLDGANMNNNFGLSSNLPGGGNPISLDAIEEMQVVIAPYDVRQSNFIGGGINAVTKSGTNKFRGTAYIYHNNENMHGNRIDNVDLPNRDKQRTTTYGFTLGGPIVKDKLFFFANYEHSFSPEVINSWRASEDGVPVPNNYISRTSVADMERVSKFVKERYGYDTGSFTDFTGDTKNTKLLGRIDWNINDDHHLAVRYNHTYNQTWFPVNASSTLGAFRMTGNRFSQYSMAFANSMYSMDNTINTLSLDLNSRFGEKFANQFLYTFTDIKDHRGSNSSPFPFIDIMAGYETAVDGTVTQSLEPYMTLGYELFSPKNAVNNKVSTFTDHFTWYNGDHRFMAGISFEHQMAENSFMKGGTGFYRYRSLDDFLNGAAPETVAITYGYNGEQNPSAKVRFNQIGLYLQDEWNVQPNFKLNYGIRFDNLHFYNSDIMTNNAIKALDFGGRHIDTGLWPKNNIQVSPRIGFNWDVKGDKSLKVRGGTGLFAGRLPLVFFTNMPTNSGMVQNFITATTYYNSDGTINAKRSSLDLLQKFAGGLVTDVNEIVKRLGGPTEITPETGTVPTSIAGVDRNFKMPQVWKSSIAVDYTVPVSFPFTLTGEFTYTKKLQDVKIENWNVRTPEADTWARLKGADNRLIYPSNYKYVSDLPNGLKLGDASVLTNTTKGHGWTTNIMASAQPIKDLYLTASYTHTVMKEVSGMPGSQAYSAWTNLYAVNGSNFATVQNSQYVIPDRVVASISYKWTKWDNFSLVYTGYTPTGWTYTYYSGKGFYDINGDGVGNDLIYIPRNDDEIKFTNEADRPLFWAYVNQDKYLRNHKGKYAEAYAVRAPWVHTFDFHYSHDFMLRTGKIDHKLQLSFDIMNVGNLFSSKWGVAKNMYNSFNGQFLKVDKVVDGVPYFSMTREAKTNRYATETWSFNRNYDQAWQMQIGLKYFFN